MITVRLDDGAVVQFPDGISQQEIATAVAKYYVAAVPIEAAVAAPASEVVDDPDHAPDASHRYETPADTTSDRLIFTPPMRRFTIEQFQNEDYIDRYEMSASLIEELRQRSGAPEPRSVDPPPPDHPFRVICMQAGAGAFPRQSLRRNLHLRLHRRPIRRTSGPRPKSGGISAGAHGLSLPGHRSTFMLIIAISIGAD